MSAIPLELRDLPQWCVYKLEDVDGEETKVPYSLITGQRASSTDPLTWSSFSVVERAGYQDIEDIMEFASCCLKENGISSHRLG